MHNELLETELAAIRNMFLMEMKDYLIALDIATDEELKRRREKIKTIESLLEEKKKELKEKKPREGLLSVNNG